MNARQYRGLILPRIYNTAAFDLTRKIADFARTIATDRRSRRFAFPDPAHDRTRQIV
ncbi:MAG: hypothetical protein RBR52_01555 [Thiomonas sp.]|uniref:hypothetical protein n=1 Tax=Thiomonas sp. TaxID=2047785 RepID=UPI002A360905|nr:hypothetical protein [Thiomonas sp.]MDY0329166.1 hypothetical protein [Thiomonas sp.]